MTDLEHSLVRLRASVLQEGEPPDQPPLGLGELDALCSTSPEHVDEVILLCLLAARQYPRSATALSHVPWIVSTMAINYPDRLAPYMAAVAGLLEAPAEQIRELAAHLVGDWWQRGHREHFPHLLRALHDPSPPVVRAALTRLRQCSPAQAVEVLEHCGRVLEGYDFASEAESPAPEEPSARISTYFAHMALLLAKQGLVNEILLRSFFSHMRGALPRLALPAPVREWLLKPTGAMDELLVKYTQHELVEGLAD